MPRPHAHPSRRPRTVLITSAGNGAGNNLIRSLRAGDSSLRLIGCHSDRFILKTSLADVQYLLPPISHPGHGDALRRLVASQAIDLVIPTTDADVRVLSRLRTTLSDRVFLPRPAAIRRCHDKYALTHFLRSRGVPAPATVVVSNLSAMTRLFQRLPSQSRLWCRIRNESGAMGAIPVDNPAQARSWIQYWRAMRGVPVTSFALSEFLPGRDLGGQMLWKDGTLLLSKTYERLSYLTMGALPTPVSSVAILSKTIDDPGVVDVCAQAIRAVDASASGVFSMDLKEDARGIPHVTDINAGRFSSATNIFDLAGKHNMAITYVDLALGDPVQLRDEYDATDDHYMVRDVDAAPQVFHADDFFDGIREVQARRLGRNEAHTGSPKRRKR